MRFRGRDTLKALPRRKSGPTLRALRRRIGGSRLSPRIKSVGWRPTGKRSDGGFAKVGQPVPPRGYRRVISRLSSRSRRQRTVRDLSPRVTYRRSKLRGAVLSGRSSRAKELGSARLAAPPRLSVS